MKNKPINIGLFILAVGIFGWLMADALTFALSPTDPISGRIRGCYTFVENVFGVLEPSDTLRSTQLYVGLLGVLIACGVVVRVFARRIFGCGNVNPVA